MTDNRPIILFDALCVLCSANAQFVLRHDRRRLFRLASLQSEAGRALCRAHGVDPDDPSTMIVVDGDRVWRESDAVLAILSGLGPPWSAAASLGLLPRRRRNPVYRCVARNRYWLFGKRDTCWLPAPGDAK